MRVFRGPYCSMVSGGFTFFADYYGKRIGFDEAIANVLEFDGEVLSGADEHEHAGGGRKPGRPGVGLRPHVQPGEAAVAQCQGGGRASVDAFHAHAMAMGGADRGGPGLRPHYGPTYYAAFVTDLDGYRLEAVHQL